MLCYVIYPLVSLRFPIASVLSDPSGYIDDEEGDEGGSAHPTDHHHPMDGAGRGSGLDLLPFLFSIHSSILVDSLNGN